MTQHHIINQYSVSGAGASLIANGIGRFAYIALMPALIQAGWFSQGQASHLGVATLIGYLFGALIANLFVKYVDFGVLIRLSMLVSGLSYLGCAFEHAPIAWFYVLRSLAGIAGAILMLLVPPAIIKMHDASIKARVSGVIFSGIGIGTMLLGTLIPLLIFKSVVAAWLGMATITLLITLLTWHIWSMPNALSANQQKATTFRALSQPQKTILLLILIAYAFDAIGFLPHTLFWVDYIVRELHMPFIYGGIFWATFGVGAAIGPFLTGFAGDKLGTRISLLLAFILKGVGVALPLLSSHPMAIFISSLLVGIFTPGTVTLISTYTLEVVGYQLHTKAWSIVSLSFAISQGIGGYFMAEYSAEASSYYVLFKVGALALVLATLCIFLTYVIKHGQSE